MTLHNWHSGVFDLVVTGDGSFKPENKTYVNIVVLTTSLASRYNLIVSIYK
jgi:hypothetical protein